MEGLTFSEGVVKAIAEYLQHHPLPNPQITLERSFNLGVPAKPAWQCCVGKCRAKARYLTVLRNFEGKEETFNLCQRHRKWRHKEFRFIVRVKKIG